MFKYKGQKIDKLQQEITSVYIHAEVSFAKLLL
jgi:hypothetical protein